MSQDTYYKIPVGNGFVAIDFGDLHDDCFPKCKRTVTFDAIQRKTDKLPEIGSSIQYQGEHHTVVKVTSDEKFWTCRKKWTRSTAMWVKNKYRRITVEAE